MNAIVVVDRNWAIGRENHLLYSLPTDMKRFRSLTLDGTVILGKNIVITHHTDLDRDGAVAVSGLDAALDAAAGTPDDRIWVIGGGSVYAALLSKCRRACVTKVDDDAEDPDAFFPNLDKLPGWELESVSDPVTENGVTYRFCDYVNTNL